MSLPQRTEGCFEYLQLEPSSPLSRPLTHGLTQAVEKQSLIVSSVCGSLPCFSISFFQVGEVYISYI